MVNHSATGRIATITISVITVFAAVDVALGAIPGWWISWAAIIKPLHGVILGPIAGPYAALIGGLIGNFIWPQTAVLSIFTWVPGVLGALATGLMIKRRWQLVAIIDGALIVAFFLHPVGNMVALWALYDKVVALILVFPTAKLIEIFLRNKLDLKSMMPALGLMAFIGTEVDDITGNVLFMYLELYKIWGIPIEGLPLLYMEGTFIMPLQRVVIAIIATIVGASLLSVLERGKIIKWPLT